MEEEKFLKKLVKTVTLLIEARYLVKDEFFSNKLENKIVSLGENCLKLKVIGGKDNIYDLKLIIEKITTNIFDLIETVKEFQYLGLIKKNQIILEIESSLLDFKLTILKIINAANNTKKEKIEHKNEIIHLGQSLIQKPEFKKNQELQDLTETKKKILNFVKSYPNSRTRDIVYEFNNVSGRTIKRNLNDLLKIGFLRKRVDNKAVYYYSSE